nr:DUF2780 domain-containing protein [Marinobacterium profundum]
MPTESADTNRCYGESGSSRAAKSGQGDRTMSELIQQLVSAAGVTEGQAEGGSGLLLKLLQDKLSAGDFSQLSAIIPNASGLLEAAPDSGGGGLMGVLGGLVSSFGGGKLGDLAGLAAGFSKLGLNADMISQFSSVLLNYIQSQGGEGVAALVKKALGQ